MRSTLLRRFLLAVALLPLMAGIAFAAGQPTFVCADDQVARVACCCPGIGHVGFDGEVAISAGCCCQISATTAEHAKLVFAPPVTAPGTAKILFTAVAVPTLDAVPPPRQGWPAVRLANPPPVAIPILLGKQSFLI